MKQYTEGIQGNRVVILEDGVPITISEILKLLNKKENEFEQYAAFCIRCEQNGLPLLKYKDYLNLG